MTDIQAAENMQPVIEETLPTTRFGTALVNFADRLDTLAGKETDFTHKQLLLTLGAEAVVGATAIALVGSFNDISSKDIIWSLMSKMKHTGTVIEPGDWHIKMSEGQWRGDSGWGFPDMNAGELARRLVKGDFQDETGKSVFLLNNESTANVAKLLDQLGILEGIRDQFRNLFLLGGVGSAVMAALQAKSGEKVKVSEPMGKIPAVLPVIANVMKGIGKLF